MPSPSTAAPQTILLVTWGKEIGNGAAPPAFTAVSALLIMAYVHAGYGAEFECVFSGVCFTIATILYVDDTDLLHWAKSSGMSEDQFFVQFQEQEATMAWGHLTIASGGSLKPEKCYWYWIAFKFRHGKAIYKLPSELPHRQLLIPTREGGEAPITLLKGPHESSNNLSILQCPILAAPRRTWRR